MNNKLFYWRAAAILFFALFFDSFFFRLPFQTGLVIITLVAVLTNWRLALLWAIGLGLVLDGSSAWPSGLFLISLVLACLSAVFLLWHFLPQRSFYSVIIVSLIGTLVFELSAHLFAYFLNIIKLTNLSLVWQWNNFFWNIFVNVLFSSLIFLIWHFSRRFWHRRFI